MSSSSSSTSDVFPALGGQILKDNVLCTPTRTISRPSSRNPFFIRNAPHPLKVRHIKGLLDKPICTVIENAHHKRPETRCTSQVRQIATNHKNAASKFERFVPGIGLVTMYPAWEDRLREFTHETVVHTDKPFVWLKDLLEQRSTRPDVKGDTRSSSRNKNRLPLIENLIRQPQVTVTPGYTHHIINSQSPKRHEDLLPQQRTSPISAMNKMRKDEFSHDDVKANSDEVRMAELIAKIFQVDSVDSVASWFQEASAIEKEAVLNMVTAISKSNDQFWRGNHDNKHGRNNQDFEHSFLYPPNSLDIEGIDAYNKSRDEKQRLTTPHVSCPTNNQPKNQATVPKGFHAEISDDKKSSRNERPSSLYCHWKDLPALRMADEVDQDVEEIRSRLASRSSVKVFDN